MFAFISSCMLLRPNEIIITLLKKNLYFGCPISLFKPSFLIGICMVLKDTVRESVYKPLAGYLALAAAVAAPVYLSNREHRRQIRDLRDAVERLEESRETDQKNVRDFLEKYVGVVEGLGGKIDKIENLTSILVTSILVNEDPALVNSAVRYRIAKETNK